MNKELCNPKQPITPSVQEFNDRDILQDCLDSLKHLGTLLGTLNTEASNQKLLSVVEQVSKKVEKMKRDAYLLMYGLGWYTMYEETKECIDKTYQQFKQYQQEQLDN